MGTVEGNIEALSQAILSEARAETEELRSRAHSQSASIRQRAQGEADRERSTILDRANQEARRLRSQATATAQLKARALELEHREQLLTRVFSRAAEQLSAVAQRSDYDTIAIQLVREALSQLQVKSAELVVDKATQKTLSKVVVDEISRDTGIQLTIGRPLEGGTGVIARSANGRLQFDNTLETRLARIRAAIRSEVYRVLMGEAG
jgi:vacuolar-type H+-ATPase subunit E/Vma4